jgi:hypothetical protein
MQTELHGHHWCVIEHTCIAPAQKRLCGHYACDGHTDSTDLCGWCVPLEPARAEALANRLRLGAVVALFIACSIFVGR